jgi:Major Facilitator Superfamily
MSQTRSPVAPPGIGLALLGVQFFFTLSWVVYAAYLPQLLTQLGHPDLTPRHVPWILALDQLVFIVTDLLVGAWSDRAVRVLNRLSAWMLGATLVSGLAFALLPMASGTGAVWLFFGLTLVWAVCSSALRAPPLTLLGRYVAKPAQPALVAAMALGLGLCNAAAPYLALQLKGVDPRWPFALSALALVAVTLGMRWAERALAASRAGPAQAGPDPASAAAAATAHDGAPAAPAAARPGFSAPVRVLLLACAVAAVAFQSHVFLLSAPLYLQHVPASALPAWLPVFWVGFNLALWPASRWTRSLGAARALAFGTALATAAVALVLAAPGLALLGLAQALAGAAWALVMCGAFSSALALGHTGREGLYNGALQAVLAFGALTRLLVVVLLAPAAAQLLAYAGLVVAGFALAAMLLAWGLKRLPGWPAPAGAPASVTQAGTGKKGKDTNEDPDHRRRRLCRHPPGT